MTDLLTNTYGAADFEKDVSTMKPRLIDIWLIPPLVMYAGWKTRDLNKWTRRMLFTAGVYMLYRNYSAYKSAVSSIAAIGQGGNA
jgi:hypothetical protein